MAAALLVAAPAAAAPACRVPANIPIPIAEGASASQPARTVPIAGYTLAMIWMPQHCRTRAPGADALACVAGRGFVLHGLWPDGAGRDYPQWCAPADALPAPTIRAHWCATPSAQLQQHEWAKHGTCMQGYTPDRYFYRAGQLFARLRPPHMAALSRRPQTVASVAGAYAAANRGLRGDMVRLNLDRQGWLEEVWLCLDAGFRPTSCRDGGDRDRPVRIWRGFR